MADTKGTDQPITRHPLFPAIVALWFGALAGLGSVVVSSSAIESIVMALGIDKVVPMTAPPLGTTMRILLALGMTGIGAAVGGLIARRLVRRTATIEADSGTATIEEAAQAEITPRRRRALAIEADPVQAVQEVAPVPGHSDGARILNVADFDIDSFDDAAAADTPVRRMPETVAPSVEPDADEENLPAWLDAESAWHEADDSQAARGVFTTPPGAQIFQVELEAAEQAARDDAEAPIGSRLFEAYSRELSPRTDTQADPAAHSEEQAAPGFSLLPRLPQGDWSVDGAVGAVGAAENGAWNSTVPPFSAPTLENAGGEQPVSISFIENYEAPAAGPVDYAPFDIPAESGRTGERASDRIVDADLGTLSQVELLERLALAMERRREESRRAAEEAALAAELPAPPFTAPPFTAPVVEAAREAGQGFVETAFSETHAQPAPEEPTWSAAVPDALRPIALDPIGDAAIDGGAPLADYLPPRHLGLSPVPDASQGDDPHAAIPFPTSPFSAEPEDEDDDPVLQQGYSSLLDLSRNTAVRKPFLQFSEPDDEGDEIAHATPATAEDDAQQPVFGRPVLLPDPAGEAPPEAEERPFDAPRNDPDATERALRAALATLQRMSGAA